MANRHINQLVYLSGIDQMVATHEGLILRKGHGGVVKVIHSYQTAAVDMVEASLSQRLAYIRIVRRNLQFHSVVARRFKGTLRRLAVGQQTAHGNDRQHADGQTEQTRNRRAQDIHGLARLLLVESADDKVRRRTDKRTHTTHA